MEQQTNSLVFQVVKEGERLPYGLYPVRLKELSVTEGFYGKRLRWKWIVTPSDGVEREISTYCNMPDEGKLYTKAIAYKWALALLGKQPTPGENFNFQDCIGRTGALLIKKGLNKLGEERNEYEVIPGTGWNTMQIPR